MGMIPEGYYNASPVGVAYVKAGHHPKAILSLKITDDGVHKGTIVERQRILSPDKEGTFNDSDEPLSVKWLKDDLTLCGWDGKNPTKPQLSATAIVKVKIAHRSFTDQHGHTRTIAEVQRIYDGRTVSSKEGLELAAQLFGGKSKQRTDDPPVDF